MLPVLLATAAALSVAVAAPSPQRHAYTSTHAMQGADSFRVRRVRLSTGIEVEFAERGHADGQPVLFLHGFPDSRVSFAPVMVELPPDFRTIAVSPRGHGESERPSRRRRRAPAGSP